MPNTHTATVNLGREYGSPDDRPAGGNAAAFAARVAAWPMMDACRSCGLPGTTMCDDCIDPEL